MNARARGAIKLLAIAYAGVAALVFLQTLALQAIPYESSAFGVFVILFRVAFFATDAAVLVALVRLSGSHASIKSFALGGAGVIVFSVASGAFGLLSHALGMPTRSERIFRNFTTTMSAAEPAIALGAALLVMFALGSSIRERSSAEARPTRRAMSSAAYAFGIAAVAWFLVTMTRATSRDAQSIVVAWIVWALEIAKPLALAVYAFLVERAFATAPVPDEGRPKVGPYREGEGPAPPSGEAVLSPPDPATIEPLRDAASGLRLYSMAFTIRLVAVFVLTIVSIGAMAGAMSGDDLWIGFVLLPAWGTITATAMAMGLGRQRALPSLRAGSRLTFAMIALGIAALSDGLFTIVILFAGLTSTPWSALRKAEKAWSLAYPTSAIFVGISVLLVGGALARSGEVLARAALTRRARWAQTLAVAAFAFVVGLFFSVGSISGHDDDQKSGGAVVCAVLVVAIVGVTIAFLVMHVLTQAEAARALRARIGAAMTARSNDASGSSGD